MLRSINVPQLNWIERHTYIICEGREFEPHQDCHFYISFALPTIQKRTPKLIWR